MNDATEGERFYGKYWARVTDNLDPERRGRVRLEVPDVQAVRPTTWAEACVPFAGPAAGRMGFYAVPPKGAAVWVEFQAGDPEAPVWTGCPFESSQDLPPPALELGGLPHARVVVQTEQRNSLMISDVPGEGLVLRASSGASIVVNEEGITISTGKGASIKLSGKLVNVNGGALEVL